MRGHAGLAAVEHRVGLAFVVEQILDLGQELRLVRRFRRERPHAANGTGVSMARALIDFLDGDGSVDFLFQGGRRTIDGIAPHAAQIGMSRGGVLSRGAARRLCECCRRNENRARDDAAE